MESQIRNRAYLRVWIGVVNVEAQKGLMFDEERNNLIKEFMVIKKSAPLL